MITCLVGIIFLGMIMRDILFCSLLSTYFITCITLDLFSNPFPSLENFSISLRIPRTPTSSASTNRNAVMFTKLYLKSSRSKVSMSCEWQLKFEMFYFSQHMLAISYSQTSWRDSGSYSRSSEAVESEAENVRFNFLRHEIVFQRIEKTYHSQKMVHISSFRIDDEIVIFLAFDLG